MSREWWRVGALLLALVAQPGSADRGADGRFEIRRSSHFLLRQDVDIDHSTGARGSRQFERDLLAVLEAAYERLDDDLGLRPPRRIDVLVYDAAIFDAQFDELGAYGFVSHMFASADKGAIGEISVGTGHGRLPHGANVHALPRHARSR